MLSEKVKNKLVPESEVFLHEQELGPGAELVKDTTCPNARQFSTSVQKLIYLNEIITVV